MNTHDRYLAVEAAEAAMRSAISALGASRELSLALTNLQQARLWVGEHRAVQSQKAPDAR